MRLGATLSERRCPRRPHGLSPPDRYVFQTSPTSIAAGETRTVEGGSSLTVLAIGRRGDVGHSHVWVTRGSTRVRSPRREPTAELTIPALAICLAACNHAASDATPVPAPALSRGPAPAVSAIAPVADGAHATIGQPAPDFTLSDLTGKPVSLHDYKGKVVVLEWFNPGCPFVNASHTKGSLKGTASRHEAQGIVWSGDQTRRARGSKDTASRRP